MIVYFVANTAYNLESNVKLHEEAERTGCEWGILLSYMDVRSTVKSKMKCGKQFRKIMEHKQNFKEELNNDKD